MDMVTLAIAKAHADRQRLAYAEPCFKILRYNGDPTGKTVVSGVDLGFTQNDNANFVRISETPFSYPSIDDITITSKNGTHVRETADKLVVECTDNGLILVSIKNAIGSIEHNTTVVWSTPYEGGGVFVYDDGDAYVSRVDGPFAETVHHIDPKYLPGVCLPVVELTYTTVMGGDASALTDKEKNDLEAVLGGPCVINMIDRTTDVGVWVVASYVTQAGQKGFVLNYDKETTIAIIRNGSGWVIEL